MLRPRRAFEASIAVAAILAAVVTFAPARPVQAADVELSGLCGDRGDRLEFWADAKRRESDQGTLTVNIYRPGETVTVRSDTTPEREADSRRGSGGPGQPGLGYSVNLWRVPDHRSEDGNFRSIETVKKPNRGAKYFVDVVFDAPDAHIKAAPRAPVRGERHRRVVGTR